MRKHPTDLPFRRLAALALPLLVAGCTQAWIDSADGIATRTIRQRQKQALGVNSDFDIGAEDGRIGRGSDMYAFVPHPTNPSVPEAFNTPADFTSTGLEDAGSDGVSEDVDSTGLRPFTLSEALAYAFHNGWDFQTQKEDLYLNALALMTERHLWTPQVVGGIRAQYANYGQVRNFDQAMTAVAELSATQQLPYGGEVAARVVNTLMRDIGRHTTSGETGTAILETDIPLLKGAGRVAYESRYQAERNLIYSVRDFEQARRDLVVSVAADYFNLLTVKTQITSAEDALENARYSYNRAKAYAGVGDMLQTELARTEVQVLTQENALISAQVRYEQALDRFKIRIGMLTTEPIDAVDADLDLFEPAIEESQATEAALAYRLDLLNTLDAVDDARRQVKIAENNFLPQFDFTGRVSMDTDDNQKNSTSYNTERALWQAFLELEVPIDRREERNEFRSSLIEYRRAERAYRFAQDNVRLDVRSALRNMELARVSMRIQAENVRVNEHRQEEVREKFDLGYFTNTRDMIEAQNDLQDARNGEAAAIAAYRIAILEFLRDCGMLRVDDEGLWVR